MTILLPIARTLALATAALTLVGCATVNRLAGDVKTFEQPIVPNVATPSAPLPLTALAAGDGGGSIYAARQGRGMSLFQDNKASDVGDLLTVALVESTTATSNSKTSINKKSGLDFGVPTLGGAAVSGLAASVEGGRTFAGDGNSAQSNKLAGQLTVRVIQDLGNGNLLVRGDKQLRLNQGDEIVQIQGIVRRADITSDNRVTSDRVADARIVYGGRGAMARSNAMGWLSRFFNSGLFPY